MARTFGRVFERKGRNGYFIRVRWRGDELQRHGGRTLRQAEKTLAKIQSMLDDGKSLDDVRSELFGDVVGEVLSFKQAAPLYLASAENQKKRSTIQADTFRLRGILRSTWAELNLSEIKPEHLARWCDARRANGKTGPTVNRDLSIISALFKWAQRMGYCETNPTQRVPRYSEKGRERLVFLSPKECRVLLDSCEFELMPLVLCALSTGMRRGELLSLQWRSVDFQRRLVNIEPAAEKTGNGRAIPMTETLCAELRRLRSERTILSLAGDDLVFLRETGAQWTASSLRHSFARALRRAHAGIESKRVTLHTLRHTAASLMVQANAPIVEVQRILGHKTIQMTMRYAHLAPDSGRDTIDRLAKSLAV